MRVVRGLLQALRPGEWVVLAFLGYCLGRLAAASGSSAPFDPRLIIEFPSADIVAAAVAFVVLKFALPELRDLSARARFAAGAAGAVLFALTLFSLDAPAGDVNVPWLARARPALFALDAVALALAYARATRARGGLLSARGAAIAARRFVAELRGWIPPVALLCFYPLVPLVMAGGGARAPDRDAALMAADRALFFGANPALALERVISAPLSEWMALCYSGYIVVILVGLGALSLRRDARAFRELATGLALTLACGYIGYTLVPAQGPMFTERFDVDLSLYYMEPIKRLFMDSMRIPRDCFPSLHTAVTLVVAFALYRHARPLFRLLLPIIVTMPFACVYLRYHYAVDVLAGMALAAATAWLMAHGFLRAQFVLFTGGVLPVE